MEDYLKAINLAKELYKDNNSLRTRNAELEAEVGRLREALGHIAEYWNRDPNEKAMTDALWEIIDTVEKALSQSEDNKHEGVIE